MPFLTELDERADVKGSRDPLGLVPVWSKFGREVVGNLTTVSNSVRGFTTLLLGLEFATQLREEFRADAPEPLEVFLRFEQLAGYARYKAQDRDVRGLRLISRRLNEGRRIRISAARADQILSNQKTYGLWGLFREPARASGMLLDDAPELTDEARRFIERHYYPLLGNSAGVRSILLLLRREAFELKPDGKDSELMDKLARAHNRPLRVPERGFYRDYLAWGGPSEHTAGRQRALAEILINIKAQEFGFREFGDVRKRARNNEPLFDRLDRIARLERLIAPAALLFGFLQDRHRQSVAAVAKQIAETWTRPLRIDRADMELLKPEIAAALQSNLEAQLWMDLAEALSRGDYPNVIRLLLAINASVMKRRHGANPWITIEHNELKVFLSDERTELTSVKDAEERWRSTYFINSLWQVARDTAA